MSCAPYFTPTSNIRSSDEIDSDFGYVYGYFNRKRKRDIDDVLPSSKKVYLTMKIESIKGYNSKLGSIYVQFHDEYVDDIQLPEYLPEDMAKELSKYTDFEDEESFLPGKYIKIVKIPPGIYRISNWIYYTLEENEKYLIRKRQKIRGLSGTDTLRIKAGMFYYLGSWQIGASESKNVNSSGQTSTANEQEGKRYQTSWIVGRKV